jgi:ferredoxin/flavodoxin
MKISICYFSGTGNTAWVVGQLVQHLTALGEVAQAFSCEQVEPHDACLLHGDMLGIAFPVHGSWAPRNFRTFLEALPAGNGLPLFALACAGYAGGDAAWYAARPLAARGYRPFLYANVFMPNNLLYPVPGPEQVQKILDKAGRKVARLASRIHARRRHVEGVHPWGWLIGLLQRPLAPPVERWMIRRLFADEGCTGCGWCAEHCPVGNIQVTGEQVRFGDACILCMRCFHHCPQQAIQWTELTRNESIFRRYPGPEGHYRPTKHDSSSREKEG